MPSTFGTTLKVSVFGQSHSQAVGCMVEGLPAGFKVDMDAVRAYVQRRAPKGAAWATPRQEENELKVYSGLNQRGETCGAPLCIVVENGNVRSHDYANVSYVPRPGHSDFAAFEKWHGHQDIPGGGHFSGRLTLPLVIAGAIAIQILAEKNITVAAHALEICGVRDEAFEILDNSAASQAKLASQVQALLSGRDFPTIDTSKGEQMVERMLEVRRAKDSAGGLIECVICGLPSGVGSPMFDGVENTIARAIFGIPTVKGIEFGLGFNVAKVRGSQNNDPYEIRDGKVVPKTNNAGGILGGITTGAPIHFVAALKPISSIALEQDSVDLKAMENTKLTVVGRHDSCMIPRAVPVVECVAACAMLDMLLSWPATDTTLV